MFTRSKRKIFYGFSILLIVTTIIHIANIHNDTKITSNYLVTPKFAQFKANNAECRNEFVDNFKSFVQQAICQAKDLYHDLKEAIEYVESKEQPQTESQSKKVSKLADTFSVYSNNEHVTILDRFNLAITQYELYPEDSTLVDELLHDMATRKIVRVAEKSGGTQLKLKITFDNGMLALVKPMRFPRDQLILPNQMQFAEFERHTAEIAAYHLDRILGFRRTMPVTGRILNVTSEIYQLAKNTSLIDTFYVSPPPDNNHCFYGTCDQYCDVFHPFCAKGDLIETAFISYFPTYIDSDIDVEAFEHPWKKSYDKKRKTIWERDPKYCEKIKAKKAFKKGRRILDLMDQTIFDFLTANRDRHHYSMFSNFGEDTFMLNFDNGRAFGHAYYDDDLNLIPIQQCCLIRSSTLKTFLRFHNGPKPLSQLMKESMSSDPINAIAPVLWEPFLVALDRRVNIILNTYRECINNKPVDDVIYFNNNFQANQINESF